MPDRQSHMNPEELAKLIRQYLAGELDDKAMHLLEKQALNDPFLADALEGYEKHNPDQRKQLAALNEQLNRRVNSKPSSGRIVNLYRWAAAAAILLLMGLGWYIVDQSGKPASDIVAVPSVAPETKDSALPQASDHTPTIKYAPAPEIAKNEQRSKTPEKAKEISVPATAEELRVPAVPQLARVKEPDSVQGLLQGKVSGLESFDSIIDKNRNYIITNADRKDKVRDNNLSAFPPKVYDSTNIALNGNINVSKGLNEAKFDSVTSVVVRGYGTLPAYKKITTGRSKKEVSSEEISSIMEYKAPTPSNGVEAYADYLKTHVKNPKHYEGTVKVTFMVMPDGTLQNIKIRGHLNKECDEEAIRLIKEGPAWLPASDGKPARITQKVKFSKEN